MPTPFAFPQAFEKTVLARHIDDERFNFLRPWHEFHRYYTDMLSQVQQQERNVQAALDQGPAKRRSTEAMAGDSEAATSELCDAGEPPSKAARPNCQPDGAAVSAPAKGETGGAEEDKSSASEADSLRSKLEEAKARARRAAQKIAGLTQSDK
jgi:hypothetical protein